MKFNLKLHQCCATDELRPIMQHILFDKGLIVASDAHALVVIDVNDLDILDYEKDQLVKLERKLVHRKGFAKIWNKEIEITDKGFMCASEHILVPLVNENSETVGIFPEWKKVIPNMKKCNNTKYIALNSRILNKLTHSLPLEPSKRGMFILYHTEPTRAIVIIPADNQIKSYGIVMPIMKDEFIENLTLNTDTMLFEPLNK